MNGRSRAADVDIDTEAAHKTHKKKLKIVFLSQLTSQRLDLPSDIGPALMLNTVEAFRYTSEAVEITANQRTILITPIATYKLHIVIKILTTCTTAIPRPVEQIGPLTPAEKEKKHHVRKMFRRPADN